MSTGKMGQEPGYNYKPKGDVLGHITMKSLTNFDYLEKSEDTHFCMMQRIAAQCLAAATFGSYLCAKSSLFQDRCASLVIAAALIFMVSNAPSYFYTHRIGLALAAHFFMGTGISTIIWYNLGVNIWVVVRIFAALSISSYFYQFPTTIKNLVSLWILADTSSTEKRITYTSKKWLLLAGPMADLMALYILEFVISYLVGAYFLTSKMRLGVVAAVAVWNFINAQFVFIKCCKFDRDAIWHHFQTYKEVLFGLYLVPRSIVHKAEEDY